MEMWRIGRQVTGSCFVFIILFLIAAALADISEMVAQLHGTMIKMENFQKLLELKKDLIAIDNLVIPGRVSLG